MRRGLRRPRLGGATRARGRAEITSAPSQARSRRGSSSPRCGWFDWCVPPESVPPLRAPALLALSLAFLALVGWGPELTAPSGASPSPAAAGGGGRGAARVAAARGRHALVGCRAAGACNRRFGSRRRHLVALGFDDGP